MKAIKGFVSNFGPYLLVEMVMPGGSLIALGMYLYRRHQSKGGAAGHCPG